VRRFAIGTTVCLALAACSSGGTPSGTPTVTMPVGSSAASGSGSATPATATGACANDYLIAVPGATWTYKVDVAGQRAVSKQTVGPVTATGFTTVTRSGGFVERDVWSCTPRGLVALRQTVTGSAPLLGSEQNFHHYKVVGISLPKNLYVGAAWTTTTSSRTMLSLLGAGSHPEFQVVRVSLRVVGEDQITTPAGSFHTLKVQAVSVTDKRSPGFNMHTHATSRSTEWLAKGVGMVRSIGSSGGFSRSSTLVAYEIP